MVQLLRIILVGLVSYLAGSFPTAFLFAKFFKGMDIRKFGSGNVGATNAFRLLGPLPGAGVLLIDVAKGIIPTTVFAGYLLRHQLVSVGHGLFFRFIFGLMVIAGHNWPIFLRFRGGKGVATSLGVLIGLSLSNPVFGSVLVLVMAVWLLVFMVSKYVSLASIFASAIFPLLVLLIINDLAVFWLSLVISVLIVFRHKSNICRLLRKEESKVNIFKHEA